jgi:hypothetical protein
MSRRRETGNGVAWTKGGSAYCIPPEDFSRLKTEWMSGRAFYEGRAFQGDPLTLKLGEIVSIQLFTPEGIAAGFEEEQADKAEDAALGRES